MKRSVRGLGLVAAKATDCAPAWSGAGSLRVGEEGARPRLDSDPARPCPSADVCRRRCPRVACEEGPRREGVRGVRGSEGASGHDAPRRQAPCPAWRGPMRGDDIVRTRGQSHGARAHLPAGPGGVISPWLAYREAQVGESQRRLREVLVRLKLTLHPKATKLVRIEPSQDDFDFPGGHLRIRGPTSRGARLAGRAAAAGVADGKTQGSRRARTTRHHPVPRDRMQERDEMNRTLGQPGSGTPQARLDRGGSATTALLLHRGPVTKLFR